MLIKIDALRERIHGVVLNKGEQGYQIDGLQDELDIFNDILNPGNELCGAAIRADAYGYAFPGNPAKAAELA